MVSFTTGVSDVYSRISFQHENNWESISGKNASCLNKHQSAGIHPEARERHADTP
jgi:hypothetical protein